MCTMIGSKVRISGAARSGTEWAPVSGATVTLDHATRTWSEHALRVDLRDESGAVQSAFELDLASARALLATLQDAMAEAERASVTE